MLDTNLFGEELKRSGFNLFIGVPCSFLKALINYAINEANYISSVNEGEALAIASGASIAGHKSVVLMQNSGLCNAISPLVSLNYPFQVPVLGFIGLRGELGIPDEPQHELMGQITEDMLKTMRLNYEYLSQDLDTAKEQLKKADEYIKNNKPFFFIVRKGTFEKVKLLKGSSQITKNILKVSKSNKDEVKSRFEALKLINSLKSEETIQIATTGMTGRELFHIEDSPNNLYMVGSMGFASSLGLGIALKKESKEVVVIDGDGALLMHMGNLATNGYVNPKNMLHILLDNNAYDSTGGQSTSSNNVNFVDIAAACGYTKAIYAHNLKELEFYIKEWKKERGLTFIYMKIEKGSEENIGRPTMKPYEVKERLKVFIND